MQFQHKHTHTKETKQKSHKKKQSKTSKFRNRKLSGHIHVANVLRYHYLKCDQKFRGS